MKIAPAASDISVMRLAACWRRRGGPQEAHERAVRGGLAGADAQLEVGGLEPEAAAALGRAGRGALP